MTDVDKQAMSPAELVQQMLTNDSRVQMMMGIEPIKTTEHWVVAVMPMLYNDRIVLTTHEAWEQETYFIAGWCYDKGGAAALAAHAWDPETEQKPVGFKKEAFDARDY